jgi:hypothetical protein
MWGGTMVCRVVIERLKPNACLTSFPVPIIAVETHGSACFCHSVQATKGDESRLPAGAVVQQTTVPDALQAYSTKRSTRRDEPVENRTVRVAHLASLSSRATSLGASSPSPSTVSMAVHRKGAVRSVTVSDERAMEAALRFTGTPHGRTLKLKLEILTRTSVGRCRRREGCAGAGDGCRARPGIFAAPRGQLTPARIKVKATGCSDCCMWGHKGMFERIGGIQRDGRVVGQRG